MARCKSCDAAILWVTMKKTGAMMPLNVTPEFRVIATEENGKGVGEMVQTYTPHWATCPQAKEWHRGE